MIPLPDWMPKDSWDAYLLMRKAMGKKYVATEHAQTLLIKKLEAMRSDGQDIEAVINESIMRSWTGLFPMKVQPGLIGAVAGQLSKQGQETANSMQVWLQEASWKTETKPDLPH